MYTVAVLLLSLVFVVFFLFVVVVVVLVVFIIVSHLGHTIQQFGLKHLPFLILRFMFEFFGVLKDVFVLLLELLLSLLFIFLGRQFFYTFMLLDTKYCFVCLKVWHSFIHSMYYQQTHFFIFYFGFGFSSSSAYFPYFSYGSCCIFLELLLH